MREKDFSNPALQFLGIASEDEAPAQKTTVKEAANRAVRTEAEPDEMESGMRKEQPAAQEASRLHGRPRRQAPEGYKLNMEYIEKRSKRLQCLITQSIFDELKAVGAETGRSVNDMVNEALENYLGISRG